MRSCFHINPRTLLDRIDTGLMVLSWIECFAVVANDTYAE
jgi:hypothetical protein